MKKLILLIFFLTACSKSDILEYNDNYYKISSPYKEMTSYSIRSYDKIDVENMLLYVSKEYFKTNNSLYQEGQYLDKETLKALILQLNGDDTYITTIYEQNYLNLDNTLKGISLAIVLDDKDESLEFGIIKANELLNYLRKIEDLKDTEIVIALYLDGIKYIGSTNDNNIKLEYINYNYQRMDSNYIMNNDVDNYNNYLAIKNALSDYDIYISGKGLYKDKTLINVKIDINKSYFKKSEILSIAEVIKDKINFNRAKIYFKEANSIKAFIEKNSDIKIHILEEI